jgi:hypothetical protein
MHLEEVKPPGRQEAQSHLHDDRWDVAWLGLAAHDEGLVGCDVEEVERVVVPLQAVKDGVVGQPLYRGVVQRAALAGR